jgi:3-hydroxyisobutyrate dehydrogenase-like beta-hydroxyacid dehydrogenase
MISLMPERIGFVGLGAMGRPIARNLVEAGHLVTVHNRTREKARSLAEQGAAVADRPAGTVSPGGVVFSMVSDDRALDEIVGSDGFLARLSGGGVHVGMSTVGPDTSRAMAARHAAAGSLYVAAPVFGRPDMAAARKLWVCLSGDPGARRRALPLLEALGQAVYEFGDDPGAANVVKLCGNFLIAASLEAMAEAWALAEKNGIARSRVAELFSGTLFAAPIFRSYGAAIAEKRYTPAGFRLALGLKDVELALGAAKGSAVPMPIASLVRDRLLSGVARGRADLDWSALAMGVSEDAGLEPD